MEAWIHDFLQWLALPQFGLSTVFVVALISATLLPLGSEPAVVGLLQLNPALFWPAILTATAGNTIGGAISWWVGWAQGVVGGPSTPIVHGCIAYDGEWPCRPVAQPVAPRAPGTCLAASMGGKDLFVELVAHCGGSTLRSCGMAGVAVLALLFLYGYW